MVAGGEGCYSWQGPKTEAVLALVTSRGNPLLLLLAMYFRLLLLWLLMLLLLKDHLIIMK